MNNNVENISFVLDYIENHLAEEITLDKIANASKYSKYHLHRMFTAITGLTLHNYIKRRRLTEAAKKLLFTDCAVLDIALESGYESQQAFTLAFKELYKKTPDNFRKKREFQPIQLKFNLDGDLSKLRGDRIMDIKIVETGPIYLVGYMTNTKHGFLVIPRLWNKLHKIKKNIPNRSCMDYLVGLNDYSKNFSYEKTQPAFVYYAAVEVSVPDQSSSKMSSLTVPGGKYAVFTFGGKTQDSLQPVIEYIYKEWFPQSNCQLNDQAKFDFARYGEKSDAKGQSNIEVWIPVV